MRNTITFGSVTSSTYGVYISGSGVFNSPEKEYDYISVPGRNGDLIGNERRMSNIKVTYPAFIYSSFKSNLRSFLSALTAIEGYKELTDTYHTDEYRMASFTGNVKVKPQGRLNAGEFDLVFNCKPQRYLTTGKTAVNFLTNGSIQNDTAFHSAPLIKVYGYGTLTIGSTVITIVDVYPYICIDSDIMDCYYESTNANDQVTMSSGNFPTLAPGSNTVSFTGNITKVEITPRWFRV